MTSLKELQDNYAKAAFGSTKAECLANGTCLSCKQVVVDAQGRPDSTHFYSEAGEREYFISGLCEKCFDKIVGGE